MDRSVLQGLAAFRWLAWAWMVVVLVTGREQMRRPAVAVVLAGLALAVTIASSTVARPSRRLVGIELAVGALLVGLDGWVRDEGVVFETGQSIGSVWPLAGVLACGVVFGPGWGAGAGVLFGAARVVSTVLNDVDGYPGVRVLSLVNTTVFYAIAGWVAGYVYRLIVRTREELDMARARDEVARTLHDGVLQTLALVERRTDDQALARLAREQERELREYLFGSRPGSTTDLGAALRRCAGKFEDSFGGRVQVLVPDDLRAVPGPLVEAMSGAVGEALTNAGKHGGAERIVVFVDEEDGLFCSVKDDGRGFDVATAREGVGITRSIKARMSEVGGRADVVSTPGTGTEVRLWLPRS